MFKQIYSENNNGRISYWYWNNDTGQIVECFGTGTMVIGYAKTEDEALGQIKVK